MVLMVPQISAIHAGKYDAACDQLSIDEDHSGITKFDAPSDPNYVMIKARLRECADNSILIVEQRTSNYQKSE
jgi:hypothetical protein